MNSRGRAPVALLIALLLTVMSSAATAQDSPSGPVLYVHSDPMFAQVFVNGELQPSLTPLGIPLDPAAGKYEIVLRKAGFRPLVTSVPAEGEWPQGIRVDLEREEFLAHFDGVNAISLGTARRNAADTAIISPLGTYELSRSENALTVSRVYPHEPLRRAAGWTAPAFLAIAAISLIDDLIEPRGSLYTSPATLAAAGFSFVSGGVFIGLSVDKVRYETKEPRFVNAKTGPSAAEALFEQASQAFRLGAFEEALNGFQRVVDEFPESGRVPAALRNIGEIYRIYRSFRTAIAFLEEIPRRYPDPSQFNPALLSISEVALETGDLARAHEALARMQLTLGGVTKKQFLLQRVAVREAQLGGQDNAATVTRELRRDYRRLIALAGDKEEEDEYQQRLQALENEEKGE
jgi:tetratricopeptide (TPR) repeat protein